MFLFLRYDIQQSGQKSTRCWFNFILNSAAAIGPSQKQTQIRVGCLAGKKELTKINFNAAFFFFLFVPHSPMWYEGAIVRRKSQLSAADKPVPVVFWHRKTLCFCQLSVGTKQDEEKADYKKPLDFYSISSFFFFFLISIGLCPAQVMSCKKTDTATRSIPPWLCFTWWPLVRKLCPVSSRCLLVNINIC